MDKIVAPGRIAGVLTLPCSKSYAQRALAAALLAPGRSVLHNMGSCDDTAAAIRCIESLGAQVHRTGQKTLTVEGGLHTRSRTLDVGESALAARIFAPVAALAGTPVRIEGSGTLAGRPMEATADALTLLGARVFLHDGHLPLTICGPLHGGSIRVDGSTSSQTVSGLLLALPATAEECLLEVSQAVSTPYLAMTIDTTRRFGIETLHEGYSAFRIPARQRYHPADIEIESDWSAAAMMLTAGALAGEVQIENLSTLSLQADKAICTALERAGAQTIVEDNAISVCRGPLKAFRFDATDCPDLFPALAALAAAAEGVSEITGARRLRHKESDRAATLREEYSKLGVEIDLSRENVMRIRGGSIGGGRVSARGDHRIAMSLALAALRAEGPVTIEWAQSVGKSYPSFFDDLERLRIQ